MGAATQGGVQPSGCGTLHKTKHALSTQLNTHHHTTPPHNRTQQLGAYTLLPYVLQAAVGASAGVLADHLVQRRRWRVRDVRVLMQCAAMLVPAAALCLAASPAVAASAPAAVALITAGMGAAALSASGVSANHLDVAPRHAGVVFGVGNTAGTIAGLLAVPLFGAVLQSGGSWALVFGIAGAFNVAGAALWALWAGDARLREDGGAHEADALAALATAAAAAQPPHAPSRDSYGNGGGTALRPKLA